MPISTETAQALTARDLVLAFVYNLLGVPTAAGVLYPVFGTLLSPMVAAAAMSLSSVSVVGNALRLRFMRFPAVAGGIDANSAKFAVAVLLLCGCLGASSASAACPPAHPAIEVEAGHGPLGEVVDVTLAQLARVTREQARPLRHPLVGAYTRSIGIVLNIEDEVDEIAGGLQCTVPEVVHVRLTLTNRAVHLPRDFAGDPCLLDLSRSHQRKHADADDALLDRLVARYPEDLRTRFATLTLEPAPSKTAARLRMTEAARRVVQQQLDNYERDQAIRAGDAVDTPEEVARLSEACGGALKSGDPL